MEKNPTAMHVVAAALQRDDELWLMHKRPDHKHHGGLWEFPGGKVEASEKPEKALIRELREELGIAAQIHENDVVATAREDSDELSLRIVITLYRCRAWAGEPAALEGGEVQWFTPAQVNQLEKPPLDIVLATQLFAQHDG